MKEVERDVGWTFEGPSAFKEVMLAVVASGMEPPFYASHWKATSGASAGSGLAIEFSQWVQTVWLRQRGEYCKFRRQ